MSIRSIVSLILITGLIDALMPEGNAVWGVRLIAGLICVSGIANCIVWALEHLL